jgi:hypothetical protein
MKRTGPNVYPGDYLVDVRLIRVDLDRWHTEQSWMGGARYTTKAEAEPVFHEVANRLERERAEGD